MAFAAGASASSVSARASAICNAQLRTWDGTDVFALSPNEVLRMAKALSVTELRLRRALPAAAVADTHGLRMALRRSAHRGRVYSRAYRADPTDGSLPQEAAYENSLQDLGRAARHAHLHACYIRIATP